MGKLLLGDGLSHRLVLFLVVVANVAAAIILAAVVFTHLHQVRVKDRHSFTLDCDFETVRKVIVRTNAAERLLEASHARIVSQDWKGFALGADKIIRPNWVLDTSGTFTIEVSVPSLGTRTIVMGQTVHITNTKMILCSKLKSNADELKDYQIIMKLWQSGDKTEVELLQYTAVEVRVPRTQGWRDELERLVAQNSRASLEGIEVVFRQIVEDYRGKRFIIPIRK